MAEINPIGSPQIPVQGTTSKPTSAPSDVSFDDMVKEADKIAMRSEVKNIGESPLSKIPVELIPENQSSRDVVGYQKTFLGTFSKGTKAEINRTAESILIKSPLGNMKLEANSNESIYVELPQGSFIGKLTTQDNGNITIESDDKKKSISIQPQSNGEVTVTNKGVDESVYLVFKPAK